MNEAQNVSCSSQHGSSLVRELTVNLFCDRLESREAGPAECGRLRAFEAEAGAASSSSPEQQHRRNRAARPVERPRRPLLSTEPSE